MQGVSLFRSRCPQNISEWAVDAVDAVDVEDTGDAMEAGDAVVSSGDLAVVLMVTCC